ncbi:MAG: peptidoglycan DD-metalloendopeptidase family protein [Acidiferrobacterales bacterium]|nr:peptidoglycan DD-metalloendopeptidase family protein [Acidiferrobacterales bacterium]
MPAKTQNTLKAIALFLVFLTAVSSKAVLANDAAEYQKNVDEIGKLIEEISKNLNTNKAALKTQQDQLLELEQEISSLSKDVQNTQQKIGEQEQQEQELLQQIEQINDQQQDDLDALSRLLVSRYTNSDNNYVKMLLNQENPYAVGRLNNYYEYFAQARQQKITGLRAQLQELSALQDQYSSLLVELHQTQQQQQEQQQKLDERKQSRQASVDKLHAQVNSSTAQLEKLKQDRARLNSLIKEIALQAERLRKLEEQRIAEEQKRAEQQAKANNTPVKPIARELVAGGFIKQQGRLSYPVSGNLKHKYNARLPESGMRSEGIFFDTNGSVSVNSIFRGRVLFADFLKGYGLLLIIDHGDDHISLYGHNEVLYKKVGDIVETNEIVAKTGTTGGLKNHGLYFEVRNNATPVDPSKWVQ